MPARHLRIIAGASHAGSAGCPPQVRGLRRQRKELLIGLAARQLEAEAEAKELVLLKRRLRALLTAVTHLGEEVDDDGDLALVSSERLARLIGFANRDSADLGPDL